MTTLSAENRLGTVRVDILRYRAGARLEPCNDLVAVEEPLEIRLRGRSLAVTMRTPGNDPELAAGFLLSEGIIHQREDILEMAPCLQSESPDNTLNVFVAPAVAVDFERLTRHVFASSSCGLCGKATIDAVRQSFPPIASGIPVSAALLLELPKQMQAAQPAFALTGGLHAAAVFEPDGRLVVLREDIGRHNAVDKALGHCLLAGKVPLENCLLVVSGRASFEILQKGLAARVPIIGAVSAPSSLAVEFARESGQTLIGFLRGETMNIYAGAQRITGLPG